VVGCPIRNELQFLWYSTYVYWRQEQRDRLYIDKLRGCCQQVTGVRRGLGLYESNTHRLQFQLVTKADSRMIQHKANTK